MNETNNKTNNKTVTGYVPLAYVAESLPLSPEFAWTDDDYIVSKTMQQMFINFIKKGNPNGDGLPKWDTVKGGQPNPPYMNIDVKSEQLNLKEDRFIFHEKYYK